MYVKPDLMFNLITQTVICSYVGQGGNCEITGKSDGEDFRRLLSAMEILHFNPEDQNGIFRILSSILHLGNVFFERYEVDRQYIAPSYCMSEVDLPCYVSRLQMCLFSVTILQIPWFNRSFVCPLKHRQTHGRWCQWWVLRRSEWWQNFYRFLPRPCRNQSLIKWR